MSGDVPGRPFRTPQATLQYIALGLALAIMVGWLLHVGRSIIVPLVVAVVIVYVINGLSRFLDHVPWIGLHIPGWVRNIFSILVILAGLALIVALIVSNVSQVAAVAPRYEDTLLGFAEQVSVFFGFQTEPTWTAIRDQVLSQIELGALIRTTVSSLSQFVGVSAVVLIYVSFLLVERASFAAKVANLSRDPETLAEVNALIAKVNQRVSRYLALKTFINILLGSVSWVVMSIVGVEFAAFWAVLIGLLNYIPYIGSFIGVTFPVMLSVVQFADFGTVVLILLVLTSVQIMVGNFIEPYVMGNSLNLSPTVILLGLAFWGGLWGVPGAILSVPITASLVIVFASFETTRPIAVLLSARGEVSPPVSRR